MVMKLPSPEEQLRVLREAVAALTETIETDKLVGHLLDAVVEICRADTCRLRVATVDADQTALTLRYARGMSSWASSGEIKYGLNDSLTGMAIKTATPAVFDVASLESTVQNPYLKMASAQSLLVMPLLTGHEPVGVLSIDT